nr:MAG TPA: hypothetical protein [Caudoviricetes sp.]
MAYLVWLENRAGLRGDAGHAIRRAFEPYRGGADKARGLQPQVYDLGRGRDPGHKVR